MPTIQCIFIFSEIIYTGGKKPFPANWKYENFVKILYKNTSNDKLLLLLLGSNGNIYSKYYISETNIINSLMFIPTKVIILLHKKKKKKENNIIRLNSLMSRSRINFLNLYTKICLRYCQ